MGRHQFEAYNDKVFDLSLLVEALPDGRPYPQHSWKQVFDALFLGSVCQFASLHQVEAECRQGVLAKRIGPVSEDTFAYALQRQDPEPLFHLGCDIARRLKRNGVLRSSWARGRVVVAIDGIEICSSYVRCCPRCLERTVKHKVDGVEREDIQYYHRLVAAIVVSAAFPIPLGLRFLEPGQSEVTAALGLLTGLISALGRRFFDVLVADALYLQRPFVEAMEGWGLEWVINLKDNQPDLLAEAERATCGPPDCHDSDAQQDLQLWHAPEVYWPVADRSVRVVKTVRVLRKNRIPLQPSHAPKQPKDKQEVAEQSTNFYATNLELGSIPPLFIHQLGRSRWRIDADAFQTLTTGGHLKQPSVHQGRDRALVVLTMIRVLAYTLTLVFYHRQVRSHSRKHSLSLCELARNLAYRFLSPCLDSS